MLHRGAGALRIVEINEIERRRIADAVVDQLFAEHKRPRRMRFCAVFRRPPDSFTHVLPLCRLRLSLSAGTPHRQNDMPDLQPTLVGANVIVRPILPSDWEGMFAAASDPEIWLLHPVRDRYTEPVFRTFFDSAVAGGSAFSIVD